MVHKIIILTIIGIQCIKWKRCVMQGLLTRNLTLNHISWLWRINKITLQILIFKIRSMSNKFSIQIIIETQFKKWKSCKCIMFMIFTILFEHNSILWSIWSTFWKWRDGVPNLIKKTYHFSIHKVVLEHLLSIAICWKEI
jgi:hypothetical protein